MEWGLGERSGVELPFAWLPPAVRAAQDGWAARPPLTSAGRPSATSRFEDLHVWTASDVILQVIR